MIVGSKQYLFKPQVSKVFDENHILLKIPEDTLFILLVIIF